MTGYVTPAQAAALWCPYAMDLFSTHGTVGESLSSINRVSNGSDHAERSAPHAHCMSDRCMMWRNKEGDASVGYCGLAVKP